MGNGSRIAVLLVVVIAITSGCSLSGKRRGASLSDAAEQAKREPEEKVRPVQVDPEAEEGDSVHVGTTAAVLGLLADDGELEPLPASAVPTESDTVVVEQDDKKWHFGMIAGFGYQSGDEFDHYGIFGLNAGSHSRAKRLHVDFGVVVATVQPKPGSQIAGAIKDPIEVSLDLGARYYLTPLHTFSGIYLFGGARYGALGWNWNEPVVVDTGDGSIETIDSDLIGVFSMFIGMGLSIMQTSHFKLGVNGSGGFKMFHDTTLEGFDNDVFGSAGILQIMFPITFGDFTP